MGFSDSIKQRTGAGAGEASHILYADTHNINQWQDGIKIGRIAQLKAGVVSDMDGTTNPVIVGAVIKEVNAIEDGMTYNKVSMKQINTLYAGKISVEVKTGDTPARFGKVYVDNSSAGEYGKVTTDSVNGIPMDAIFVAEEQAGVWSIRINKAS